MMMMIFFVLLTGKSQLETDLGYLANVLNALGVELDPSLALLQQLLSVVRLPVFLFLSFLCLAYVSLTWGKTTLCLSPYLSAWMLLFCCFNCIQPDKEFWDQTCTGPGAKVQSAVARMRGLLRPI